MRTVFEDIVFQCDGMLPPAVYERIYESAKCGGLIVEIGTALGASTVALALGLRESGKVGRIYSFDPMLGGPRRQIDGVAARVAHVRENLRHFGVEHLVEIVTSPMPQGASALPPDTPIALLMIDADGRIDRDFLALYDRLAPGAPVIIDDCVDMVHIRLGKRSIFKIDAKMRATYLLVEKFKRAQLLTGGEMVKDTYFGAKPRAASNEIDLAVVVEAYRQLVFTSARFSPLQIVRRSLILLMERLHPGTLQSLRIRRRRSVSHKPDRARTDTPLQ